MNNLYCDQGSQNSVKTKTAQWVSWSIWQATFSLCWPHRVMVALYMTTYQSNILQKSHLSRCASVAAAPPCRLVVNATRRAGEILHRPRTIYTRRIGRIGSRDRAVTVSSALISCRRGPSHRTGSTRPSSSREWRWERTTCSTRSWSVSPKDLPFAKRSWSLFLLFQTNWSACVQ